MAVRLNDRVFQPHYRAVQNWDIKTEKNNSYTVTKTDKSTREQTLFTVTHPSISKWSVVQRGDHPITKQIEDAYHLLSLNVYEVGLYRSRLGRNFALGAGAVQTLLAVSKAFGWIKRGYLPVYAGGAVLCLGIGYLFSWLSRSLEFDIANRIITAVIQTEISAQSEITLGALVRLHYLPENFKI
jgi:hypothetical protein